MFSVSPRWNQLKSHPPHFLLFSSSVLCTGPTGARELKSRGVVWTGWIALPWWWTTSFGPTASRWVSTVSETWYLDWLERIIILIIFPTHRHWQPASVLGGLQAAHAVQHQREWKSATHHHPQPGVAAPPRVSDCVWGESWWRTDCQKPI